MIQLGAHGVDGPAAKILVDVVGGDIQICLRKIQAQHPVTHHSRASYDYRQNFLISQPRKVNMFESVLRPADGDRDPNIFRDQRKHMRSALHELLHVGDSVERAFDHALIFVAQPRFAGQLFDVIAITLRTGHAAGGSMRLLQEPHLRKIRHNIADGRGAEAFAIGTGQGS